MMPSKRLRLISLSFCLLLIISSTSPQPQLKDTAAFQFTDHSLFNADCDFSQQPQPIISSLKLHPKRRRLTNNSDSILQLQTTDLLRLRNHRKKIIAHKKTNHTTPRHHYTNRKLLENNIPESQTPAEYSGQLTATIESGVSSGAGVHFINVFVGTPPKPFSLILDTGSDLNWIQCAPCLDCFDQNGQHYDPISSTTFRNISCNDEACKLVTSPEPKTVCNSNDQSCPYFYWYGDNSNTTGDFASETFTLNLANTFMKVKNVMFGCGHMNKGSFHGASGLLGLGRGPLSFASQLQALYG